jgi:septal ring factor EnvC (AmiA/AmiB activator)
MNKKLKESKDKWDYSKSKLALLPFCYTLMAYYGESAEDKMDNPKPSYDELLRQLREVRKLNKKTSKRLSGMQKKIKELEKENQELRIKNMRYEIITGDYCD